MNLCAKTIKASGLKLVPLLEKIRDVPEALFAGVFVRFSFVSLVFQIDPHPRHLCSFLYNSSFQTAPRGYN